MKIIIACDSFKGSLSSIHAAEAIAEGLQRANPNVLPVKIPVADGGEGTVEAFLMAAGGRKILCQVAGPMGSPVEASYVILPDGTAVIEMAQASGLPLLTGRKKDPLRASTYGTGELIRNALDAGCRKFLIGIGGSATTDGGAGMLQALGMHLLDEKGQELAAGGGELLRLQRIDLSDFDPRIGESEIQAACDVVNPLCGAEGAAAVYGPQKGAKPEEIVILDRALSHFADAAADRIGKDYRQVPGAGAAGGLGMGLLAFCGASLKPGIELILDAIGFEGKIEGASFVITGEGCIDAQSIKGKVPVGVARRVKASNPDMPVFALVGSIGPGAEKVYGQGIDSILSIVPGAISLEQSMACCREYLADAADRLMRLIQAARKIDG